MTFAEKLRVLREQAGMSQAVLAKTSGVPLWTLRKFEQGRREPLWLVLFQLADALGVPVDAFRDCLANHRPPAKKPITVTLADEADSPPKRRRTPDPTRPEPTYKASPLTRSLGAHPSSKRRAKTANRPPSRPCQHT